MLIFAAQSWPGRKKVLRYVNNIKWAPMPATSCLRCKNLIWRRKIVRAAAADARLNRRRVFFAAKRETLCYFIQHLAATATAEKEQPTSKSRRCANCHELFLRLVHYESISHLSASLFLTRPREQHSPQPMEALPAANFLIFCANFLR